MLHRERNEHDRVAVDRDLERLQFAQREISRIVRNESVNERIRISPKLPRDRTRGDSRTADILDDQNVALVIRMDAFVTAAAEAAIERSQTLARSGGRIKIRAHLDNTADSTVFLGKEECATNRIPS